VSISVAGSRILVTGGSGLIGRPTVDLLAGLGATVTVYDRANASEVNGVNSVTGDLRNVDLLREVMSEVDAVVHLGGIPGPELVDDITTYEINTVGTYAVFSTAAAAKVEKVVYASSINANGLPISKLRVPSSIPYDEDELATIGDSYSLSKQANENAAQMAAARWGLPLTGLRFPLVRDITQNDGATFAEHIRTALRKDPIRQAYEGWSYLHSADAARAVVHALTHDTPPAPGILIAAPLTYLTDETRDAVNQVIPGTPLGPLRGREVGLDLTRARTLLQFEAETLLESVGPGLLASVEG
jgi:nucleoside-diphosphate-sugar epimerase